MMLLDSRLLVNDIFTSIQGEGYWTGTPMTFLRLQGCNLRCSWCDTPQAQATRLIASESKVCKWMTVRGISHELRKLTPSIVCVTGGEPLLQRDGLSDLITHLRTDFRFHLETNGTIALPDNTFFHWATVSPKPPDYEMEAGICPDEVKIVVTEDTNITKILQDSRWKNVGVLSLQPVDNNIEIAKRIINYLRSWSGYPVRPTRLSMQIHKFLDIP